MFPPGTGCGDAHVRAVPGHTEVYRRRHTLTCCPRAVCTPTLELSQAFAVPSTGHTASWGLTFTVLLHCSQDSDLPTLISSVHRSRHLVMPEHQSRCEFQRGGVEIGLGATGEELRGENRAARATEAQPEDSLPCHPPSVSAQQLWMPPPPAALAGSQGGQRRREVARPAVPWGSM